MADTICRLPAISRLCPSVVQYGYISGLRDLRGFVILNFDLKMASRFTVAMGTINLNFLCLFSFELQAELEVWTERDGRTDGRMDGQYSIRKAASVWVAA